jgi:hypothetical protein
MWDLWWTKWHWDRFSPSTSVFPRQFHSTCVPLLANEKTNLHHRVASVTSPQKQLQHRLSIDVWCDVTGDQLTGMCILPQHELPAPWRTFQYEHDVRGIISMTEHLGCVVPQFLNQQFPNRCVRELSALQMHQ